MKVIESLEWDTDFFGISIGKFTVDRSTDISQLKEILDDNPFRLLYVKIKNITKNDQESYSDVGQVKSFGLSYEKCLAKPTRNFNHEAIYNGTLSDELEELAWVSGQYSRFNIDRRLRPFFKKMYSLWLEKSIHKELADVIFIYSIGKLTVGLVTVSLHEDEMAQIGLLSVSEKKRGLGIATELMANAEAWCYSMGKKRLRVVTQAENIPACSLYDKLGFEIKEYYGIFHHWMDMKL